MPTVGNSAGLAAGARCWTSAPTIDALGDERDEQPADASCGDAHPRRRGADAEQADEQGDAAIGAGHPFDRLVARTEVEGQLEPPVRHEREADDGGHRSDEAGGEGDGQSLGVADRPGAGPGEDAAGDAEGDATDEVSHVERRGAAGGEQRLGADDGDVRQVGGAGGGECRGQRAAGEIAAVGDFEREADAGQRCFEDGGDAGRGPRHHQHLGVVVTDPAGEPSLERRPDGAADEQGRALEARARCRTRAR